MSIRHRRAGKKPEVDISPLIDVVFILLIFFMVTTTFVKESAVDIERPGASSGSTANSKALRIVIDQGGALYLGDTPIKAWMLQSRVREFIDASGTKSILIVTDRRVAAERLVEVVDQCRLAGATDVGVATEKEAG